LGQADPITPDRRHYEFFEFEGRKGQPIVLTLKGSNDANPTWKLSPYFIVYAPSGEVVARNDVAGGDRTLNDERQRLRLPDDGNYRVAVFADPEDIGRFSLTLQRDTVLYRYEQAGELTANSVTLRLDDSPIDAFQFYGTPEQFVRIQLDSPDFDSYLFLIDPDGEVVAQDDDSGGNLNARIETELKKNGLYTVVINSFGATERGRYRLTIF
jgi:hypothetical protein